MDASVKKSKDATGPVEVTPPPAEPTNGPVKTLRVEDCSASIFARTRQTKTGPATFYSVSFSRSYKDASGAWKYTKNFDAEDLGKVQTLCGQAADMIQMLRGLVPATSDQD